MFNNICIFTIIWGPNIIALYVLFCMQLATKNTEEVPAKTLKKNEFKQKVFEAESDLTNKMQFSNKIGMCMTFFASCSEWN